METILIKAAQLILSLSILVLVHELGHFFFARLFKVRVDKFYLFFNPWFTLYKFKPKNSHTEWGIGWLPLGGYCKINGMIDESMDTEAMKQPEQPWEYRSKPVWQRLLIIVGGVLFNFLLALFIYSMVLYVYGEKYWLPKDFNQGMQYGTVAKDMGFQDGDILLKADGAELAPWPKSVRQIAKAAKISVEREGEPTTVYMGDDLRMRLIAEKDYFATPIFPYIIDSVKPDTPLARAGMGKGDRILALNSQPLISFADYKQKVATMQAMGAKRNVSLVVQHTDNKIDTIGITLDEQYQGGAYPYPLQHYVEPRIREYDFFASIPAGITNGVETMTGYVSDMKYVFTKEGANSLGGFGTIGSIFSPVWDWESFWIMTAFLSIILAVMNILPIPALDGGHVVFLIYEAITRRKPSIRFMEVTQMVGMVLLIALMLWANLNDVIRLL